MARIALGKPRWLWVAAAILAALALLALVFAVGLYLRYGRADQSTPYFEDIDAHFKHGSIGSEVASGIPYWAWQALPRLFPEEFAGRTDYAAFGFLYDREAAGDRRALPIGVSRRRSQGVDMVWFNCAVCHAGTWRPDAASAARVVLGMPSNNLDFGAFVRFLLGTAAVDARIGPAALVRAAEEAGADFGPVERRLWLHYIAPQLREGLLDRRARLLPLLDMQPPWGPGRVDTFNPYKALQLGMSPGDMSAEERVGAADFPSIFLQRPRAGMQLHWDGNNTSLMERNLSAAIGAGVTPGTVAIPSIERVADWLLDLRPPPSPLRPPAAAAARGRDIYMRECASCHGYRGEQAYVFEGERLGKVTPIEEIGTDRARLDSYTEAFRRRQLDEIFEGTPYDFKHFVKTGGYANQPLEALWLRGPYLHNGSVPTLAALLAPPGERPTAYVRGFDIPDRRRGGFIAPPCDPSAPLRGGAGPGRLRFCFDTRLPGNGNGGHLYGTGLPADAKADLLAYLMTF
ncbi:MAG: hypothetical protein ACFBQW_09505 [Sphingomonadaceae bacterium]